MCKTRFDPLAIYHTDPEAMWKSVFQRLSQTPLSRSEVRQITLGRTSTLGHDIGYSKAHRWTQHRGMGKCLGLHSKVRRDGRLVHHLKFSYGLSRAVHDHIDAKVGGFSFQGQDDEQFRLELTRSTAFKVRLKLRARGQVKFVSSAIIVLYLV
jgi:hypothetical protein